MSWFCAIAAVGVVVSGLRDLGAARRTARLTECDPAGLAAALPDRRSILVTGGTGFIGSRLVTALLAAGHEVTVLTRSQAKALPLAAAGPLRCVTSLDEIANDIRIDAIVNLAGEPISDPPWTRAKRMRIMRSRLETTYGVVRLIARLDRKLACLISGSAIGWCGLRGSQALTEANLGTPCFSRCICVSWENAVRRAERYGVRTVYLRTGLVLDRSGGLLASLLAPFEFGLGGKFGDGRHWMSWIHLDDIVRLICQAIARDSLTGPINAVAPEPVTKRRFTTALARALGRLAIVPIPAWPLNLGLGDFAKELLLSGQRVYPDVAMRRGFIFDFAELDDALALIVGNPKQSQSPGVMSPFSALAKA